VLNLNALNPKHSQTVLKVLSFGLWAMIVLQGAALFWLWITPLGPIGAPLKPEASSKVSTDILGRFDPFGREMSGSVNGGASGAFVLYGTRTDLSGQGGSAIISISDGPQTAFGVGDELAPGVRLLAVAIDHVILDQSGQRQTLSFTDIVTVAGNSDEGSRSGSNVVGQASGLSLLDLSPASGGLKVGAGANGAVLSSSGLVEGDVITAINGQPLSQDRFDTIQSQLASGGNASMSILRNGEAQTLQFKVP
jgi:general secretion pathway protein C